MWHFHTGWSQSRELACRAGPVKPLFSWLRWIAARKIALMAGRTFSLLSLLQFFFVAVCTLGEKYKFYMIQIELKPFFRANVCGAPAKYLGFLHSQYSMRNILPQPHMHKLCWINKSVWDLGHKSNIFPFTEVLKIFSGQIGFSDYSCNCWLTH